MIDDNVRAKGRAILKKNTDLDDDNLNKLENAIHDQTIRKILIAKTTDKLSGQRIYDQILRNICLISKKTNIKECDLEKLPSLSDFELNPDSWQKQNLDQKILAQQVAEGSKKPISKILKCTSCAKSGSPSNMVISNEIQDRSADEAMTIHAHCQNCGKKWKQ